MTTTPDDETPAHPAPPTQPRPGRRALRAASGVIKEIVLETVGEVVVQVLSCLLLAAFAAGVFWSWQRSRVLASGVLVLLAIGAVATITRWRHPGPLRVRQLGVTLLTVLLLLGLWFLFYGTNCGCLTT